MLFLFIPLSINMWHFACCRHFSFLFIVVVVVAAVVVVVFYVAVRSIDRQVNSGHEKKTECCKFLVRLNVKIEAFKENSFSISDFEYKMVFGDVKVFHREEEL